MLGILATLFAGAYLAGEGFVNASMDSDARGEAAQSGNKTYMDSKGRTRSLETGEICVHSTEKGHYVVMGYKSGRIYQDFTQERLAKRNEELRENGKKYFLKEYFNKSKNNVFTMNFDPVQGLPYKIEWRVMDFSEQKEKYGYTSIYPRRYPVKAYYDGVVDDWGYMTYHHSERITEEEERKYWN